jgi:two-component system nitrogen regulation sensor histidine kinase GlnL
VQDDGEGVPEPLRDKVFAPFFTTRAAGTGLGLAIVRKVVDDHGGSIDVESQPGRTEFRMVLPQHDEAASDGPS